MKKSILLILLVGLTSVLAGDEYGLSWTKVSQHQTNNTTWTPATGGCKLNTFVLNVSNAGTSWIITVKDKASTPRILWTGTATLGTVTVCALPVGIWMEGGIDVTFSGTAGTADFFATFR